MFTRSLGLNVSFEGDLDVSDRDGLHPETHFVDGEIVFIDADFVYNGGSFAACGLSCDVWAQLDGDDGSVSVSLTEMTGPAREIAIGLRDAFKDERGVLIDASRLEAVIRATLLKI